MSIQLWSPCGQVEYMNQDNSPDVPVPLVIHIVLITPNRPLRLSRQHLSSPQHLTAPWAPLSNVNIQFNFDQQGCSTFACASRLVPVSGRDSLKQQTGWRR